MTIRSAIGVDIRWFERPVVAMHHWRGADLLVLITDEMAFVPLPEGYVPLCLPIAGVVGYRAGVGEKIVADAPATLLYVGADRPGWRLIDTEAAGPDASAYATIERIDELSDGAVRLHLSAALAVAADDGSGRPVVDVAWDSGTNPKPTDVVHREALLLPPTPPQVVEHLGRLVVAVAGQPVRVYDPRAFAVRASVMRESWTAGSVLDVPPQPTPVYSATWTDGIDRTLVTLTKTTADFEVDVQQPDCEIALGDLFIDEDGEAHEIVYISDPTDASGVGTGPFSRDIALRTEAGGSLDDDPHGWRIGYREATRAGAALAAPGPWMVPPHVVPVVGAWFDYGLNANNTDIDGGSVLSSGLEDDGLFSLVTPQEVADYGEGYAYTQTLLMQGNGATMSGFMTLTQLGTDGAVRPCWAGDVWSGLYGVAPHVHKGQLAFIDARPWRAISAAEAHRSGSTVVITGATAEPGDLFVPAIDVDMKASDGVSDPVYDGTDKVYGPLGVVWRHDADDKAGRQPACLRLGQESATAGTFSLLWDTFGVSTNSEAKTAGYILRRARGEAFSRTVIYTGTGADVGSGVDADERRFWAVENGNEFEAADSSAGPIVAAVGMDDRSILFHRHAIVEVVGTGPLAAIRSPDFAARVLSREHGLRHGHAVAVVDGGQAIFFATDDGLFVLQGGAVERVDDQIRRHEAYGPIRSLAYADGRLWASVDDGTYAPRTFILDVPTGQWHSTRRVNNGGGPATGDGASQVIAPGLICAVAESTGERVLAAATEIDADTAETVIVVRELLPASEPDDRALWHGVRVVTAAAAAGTDNRLRKISARTGEDIGGEAEIPLGAESDGGEEWMAVVAPRRTEDDELVYDGATRAVARGSSAVSIVVGDGAAPIREIRSIVAEVISRQRRRS